ncbi:alpha/beta fold hydrolase, partial [Gordonia sp. C13]|uniref:alpha/beta fold hydrolase n=1 Tax=Gordonia sp. C13 TaxID=2935078 RepID=UPI00200A2A55
NQLTEPPANPGRFSPPESHCFKLLSDPGAELRIVPEAGHLIQLDAPERLTGILLDWLARLPH